VTDARASAPGRVNLIGEHTDYNGGFVLPVPIPQRAAVELRPRADALVRVWSRELGEDEYRLGEETRRGTWIDYVQGCTAMMLRTGAALGGMDLRIASDVPPGAGLASSAALAVAVLRALREAFALALDDVQLALVAQRAEHELVGAPVGVMDPLCASLGTPGAALFIDTRSLESRLVPLPATLEVVAISSGIRHEHASGGYRVRRRECEEAARLLGVTELRDLIDEDAPRIAALPPPLDRRVRHVVSENARVLAAVAALDAADVPALGSLLRASHESLRADFEVSIPAIDTLVALAAADPDIAGARLTGGGFGGSIVALAGRGTGAAAARRIADAYAERTGLAPRVLVAEAAA
jgi:galactokinase